jgi:hypothetical protein
MNRWLKFTAIAFSIVGLIITATSAQASQQGRIYKDQSGAIFIYGLQPGETIETGRDFAPARFITSNACGMLIIKPSKTQPVGRIRVEGQTIDSATLATQLLPACKDGQLAEPRSQPFRTGASDVIIPLAPNRRYQVSMLDRRALRGIKANACGFVRMPSDSLGDKPLLTTTSGTVARFAIADLPTGEQILCQRRQLYKPASFPPPLASAMSNQTIVDEGGTAPTTPSPTPPTPNNSAPTISAIALQTVNMNSSITVNFAIGDAETPANQLTLSSSQHQPLVPNSGVVFGGSGANRSITITPAQNSHGVVVSFTISVSDGSNTTSTEFMLSVINQAPALFSKAYISQYGKLEITNLSASTFYTVYFEEPQTIQTNQCGRLIVWDWQGNEARLFSGSSMEDDWSNMIKHYTQGNDLEYGDAPPCN